jgi:hypothetical protein
MNAQPRMRVYACFSLVECLKILLIAPEAMTKLNIEKDLSTPEDMYKYSRAKKRVAECSTFFGSAPEDIGKSDKGGCLEFEKANVWKTRSSKPEAMPKVGIARGPNMNTSKLHTSHPSVPEAMFKMKPCLIFENWNPECARLWEVSNLDALRWSA